MLLTDHQPDNYRISIWSLKSTQPEINWLPNLNDQNKEGYNILVHIVLHSVRTSLYIHYTQCFGTPERCSDCNGWQSGSRTTIQFARCVSWLIWLKMIASPGHVFLKSVHSTQLLPMVCQWVTQANHWLESFTYGSAMNAVQWMTSSVSSSRAFFQDSGIWKVVRFHSFPRLHTLILTDMPDPTVRLGDCNTVHFSIGWTMEDLLLTRSNPPSVLITTGV